MCLTQAEIDINGGQIVRNYDGTVSVYTVNQVTGQLAPVYLTKPCCEILGYTFDSETQKCLWSDYTNCSVNTIFNLVLNPKGNDGTIFNVNPDENCTLSIDFDYLFKFDCSAITDFMNNQTESVCEDLVDIFETIGASVTLDVVTTINGNLSLTPVFTDILFQKIGSGNLSTYLTQNSGNTGFFVCSTIPDESCAELDLYDIQTNKQSNCSIFVPQILTALGNVPSNSFASDWLHYNSEITDPIIISAITNEKIKISIQVSGACIDVCVLIDNIKLNRNCSKVTGSDIFLTKSPSFELDRIIDNKKSWIKNTETTHRIFNITKPDGTNPIRHTDYYLDDDRQVINTKEIDLDINIASAVETDVWCYVTDNSCILTGNTIGTTTCVKNYGDSFSGAVVYTSVTANTNVVTGTCCPVTAITSTTTTGISTTYTCPIGYSATPENDICQNVTVRPATLLGLGPVIEAGDKDGLNYSVFGTYFYPLVNPAGPLPYTYANVNGNIRLVDAIGTVIPPVTANTTSSFWASLGLNANGRLNNIGIKAPNGSWAGFSQCVNISSGGTYYVGLAADNRCRFSINGVLVANFDNTLQENFRIWSVFPVQLNSGLNIITMEGRDDGVSSTFGAEVYYPTNFNALYNASGTGLTQANVLFSTLQRVGTNFDFGAGLGYSCGADPAFVLNTCGTPTCSRILNTNITATNTVFDITTTGYCTDIGNPTCVTYTLTAQSVTITGYNVTTATTFTNRMLSKTYCCSEYCGDANIDIYDLLTQPISGVTTIEDFEYLISSELIDAKTRKTLSSYPTLRLLYERYLNSVAFCGIKSSRFNYETMNQFANLIGEYWVDLIEQVIPATTIWGSTKIYTNTIFDKEKFKYKGYTTFFGPTNYTKVLSPATGTSYNTSATTSVVYGSSTGITSYYTQSYDNLFVKQMNSGSEFVGTVNIFGTGNGGPVISECTLQLEYDTVNTDYGESNGSATVYPVDPNGPVTYSWAPIGGNRQREYNLSAGTYTVTATDAAGCVATVDIVIVENPPAKVFVSSSSFNGGVTNIGGIPLFSLSGDYHNGDTVVGIHGEMNNATVTFTVTGSVLHNIVTFGPFGNPIVDEGDISASGDTTYNFTGVTIGANEDLYIRFGNNQ